MNKLSHNPINVEIVTPETSFARDGVYVLLMPGVNGEFGVSPGHVPLLVGLQAGLVTCYNKEMQVLDKIFIDSGFVEVAAEHATLLVERAVNVSSCNSKDLTTSFENLIKDLENCKSDIKKQIIEKDIDFTKTLLDIVRKIEWKVA